MTIVISPDDQVLSGAYGPPEQPPATVDDSADRTTPQRPIWRTDEEIILARVRQQYRRLSWTLVARMVYQACPTNRPHSAEDCRHHWTHVLGPFIARGRHTEEDRIYYEQAIRHFIRTKGHLLRRR